MTNETVRQHWVPRAYLRAFCAEPVAREQIHARNLASGADFLTSIDRVAVMRHMYTLGLGTTEPSFAVEDALARLESDAAEVLAEILKTTRLPNKVTSKALFARFIGTQLMRTRQGLQVIHGHREEVRAGTGPDAGGLPLQQAEQLIALDDDGMRELFAKSAVIIGGRLESHILRMHWSLIQSMDSYFITSENPVFTYHPGDAPWGLGSPGSSTYFPLSPKLFLHLSNEEVLSQKQVHHLPAEGVRGLNGLTILAAEQFVYSHVPLIGVQDLLADRAESKGRAFGPRAADSSADA